MASRMHTSRWMQWVAFSGALVSAVGCSGADETGGTDGTTVTGSGGGSTSTGQGGGAATGGGTTGIGGGGSGGGMMTGPLEVVVAGQSDSPDLPGALNAFKGGGMDGMVIKLSLEPDGSSSTVLWSRYVGGSDYEQVRDVAFDDQGHTYVTGRMASNDMATTNDAQQPAYGGGGMDAFLNRFDPDGNVAYASYFGGSNYDVGYGISVTSAGEVVLSGRTSSTNMPTTANAPQPSYAGGGTNPPYFGGDYFAFKLSDRGRTIDWGTYAGGNGDDAGRGRNAIGSDGVVWVGGRSLSNNFPAVNPKQGSSDGGVIRIAADGTSMTGLHIGGSADLDAATGGTLVLPDGSVIICGYSTSADLPMTTGSAQPNHAGGFDGMLAHVSADGTQLLRATFMGGSGYEECQGVDRAPDGDIVAMGMSTSSDFPVTQGTVQGGSNIWVARLSPDLTTVRWAITVGGSGDEVLDAGRLWVTPGNDVLLAASTQSTDLPVTAGAAQSSFGGGSDDVFVALLAGDGSGVRHMTYLGGSASDFPRAMALRAP